MDHKGSHLWLIPVIIIGFNSLVFVCLIMIGYKKQTGEAADMRKTAVSESSVSADGDVSGNEAELDESFYDEEEPEENIYAYNSGYVLLLTSSESDLKIQMVREDGRKIFTGKNVIRMLSIFLIPTVLGLLKSVANLKELSGDDAGIARDGGCYTDLYSNFLLLIPFAMLGGYFLWTRKESGYILPVLFVLLGFMAVMFLGGMLGRVSAYYYMKNNSLLWLYLWVLTAEAVYAMLEKSRLAVAFVLFFAAILGITIYVEPEIMRRNGRFISVSGMNTFHVVYFNRTFYLNDGPLEDDLIELYKYVYDNCGDKDTVSVNGEVKNGWFTALKKKKKRFCYGGPDDYKALIDENTGYVCAGVSGEYEVVKELLTPYPVIYENSAGRIYKIR